MTCSVEPLIFKWLIVGVGIRIELKWNFLFLLFPFGVLQKMDMNQDGVVTLDEFISCCRNDEVITNSMIVFDNIVLWQIPQCSM